MSEHVRISSLAAQSCQVKTLKVPGFLCGGPGEIVFETDNVEPHEMRAYEVLRSWGHSFRVLAVDPAARARGLSSLDIEMCGGLWELKCPRGSNMKKTIGRNLNRAVEQASRTAVRNGVRIILSALEVNIPTKEVVYRVEKKLLEGKIDELILILSQSDVRYYQKNAEIPIALLRQAGGCLRTENYTITTDIHDDAVVAQFTCTRVPLGAARYAAARTARVETAGRRCRLSRRREAR